jgi:hypothetical protein
MNAGLRINLIARNNGVGLSADLRLLGDALRAQGHAIEYTNIRGGKFHKYIVPAARRAAYALRRLVRMPRFDLNLMLEHVRDEYAALAHRNAMIPNPEWQWPHEVARFAVLDHVLVKTHHASSIFRTRGCRTTYIGFTSPDRLDLTVPRRREFLHLAGRSELKGTQRLLALWRRHPDWPRLTVVQHAITAKPGPPSANIDHRIGYIDDASLKRLQNELRFHLCPSEAEGYGHYIVEALGVGAAVVTIDAAPMNELVTRERGVLVACRASGQKNLAIVHEFDEDAMTVAVERLIATNDAGLDRLGAAARAWYEENDRGFGMRLKAGITAAMDSDH